VTYEHHAALLTVDHHREPESHDRIYNLLAEPRLPHRASSSPRSHWSELPVLHETIEEKIPESLVNPASGRARGLSARTAQTNGVFFVARNVIENAAPALTNRAASASSRRCKER
jgi:hypothetical protein